MRARLQAGQAATATALGSLADRVERLALSDAAEVLAWQAERILGAQLART
jgi:hypothetical protein